MEINLGNVKKRSHQEISEKGTVKSNRGGWAKPNMVNLRITVHSSLKKRIKEYVMSEDTISNTEVEVIRRALDEYLKKRGF